MSTSQTPTPSITPEPYVPNYDVYIMDREVKGVGKDLMEENFIKIMEIATEEKMTKYLNMFDAKKNCPKFRWSKYDCYVMKKDVFPMTESKTFNAYIDVIVFFTRSNKYNLGSDLEVINKYMKICKDLYNGELNKYYVNGLGLLMKETGLKLRFYLTKYRCADAMKYISTIFPSCKMFKNSASSKPPSSANTPSNYTPSIGSPMTDTSSTDIDMMKTPSPDVSSSSSSSTASLPSTDEYNEKLNEEGIIKPISRRINM